MYWFFDRKLDKNIINLAPGEFYVTGEDIVINTVLGSCVAVVLYDPQRKIGGLNHFMLAEAAANKRVDEYLKVERYGLYAMEALINEFLKLGSTRRNLKAKIFGGGKVLANQMQMNIGEDNIKFAEEYLAAEGIPVVVRDTGGTRARKIYLYPTTFRVLLKRLSPQTTQLEEQMKLYREKIKKKKDDEGTAVIF
jgi:chemotaxis protein CheD